MNKVYENMLRTTLMNLKSRDVKLNQVTKSTLIMLDIEIPKNMKSIKLKLDVISALEDYIDESKNWNLSELDLRSHSVELVGRYKKVTLVKKDRFLETAIKKQLKKPKKVKIPIIVKESKQKVTTEKKESNAFRFRLYQLIDSSVMQKLRDMKNPKTTLIEKLKN